MSVEYGCSFCLKHFEYAYITLKIIFNGFFFTCTYSISSLLHNAHIHKASKYEFT